LRPGIWCLAIVLLGLAVYGVYLHNQAQQARQHLEEAERALEGRQFGQAGQYLERYLQIRPRNAASQFLAARTFRRADVYDKAEEHLDRAEQLGWDRKAVHLERLLLRAQQGDMPEAAEKALWDLLQREPGRAEVPLILEALAKTYLQMLKPVQAMDCLRRWHALEPENVQMLMWRGWLFQDDPVAALDYFERAVQLDPDNEEARMLLADQLLTSAQPAKAGEQYERLREQLPGQPAVLLRLARCRIELHQPAEAKQLLDDLLNDGRFAEVLGPSRQGQRRLPEPLSPPTRAWVQQALHMAPYNLRVPSYLPSLYAQALLARAQISLQENDPHSAEGWLRESVLLNPADQEANLKLSQCLEKQGKHAEAQTYRARWQSLKDQDQQAGELMERAKLSGRDPDLRCRLGELLLRLGRERDALHWFETALRQDARHERTRQLVQQYYDQSGDPMALSMLRSFAPAR
jgi:tetratricopeptide (TPR) repeat protein